MTSAARLIRRSDPARRLTDQLDERAESELADLVGRAPALRVAARPTEIKHPGTRWQPMLVTVAVAVVVVALSAVVLTSGPTVHANDSALPATRSAAATGSSSSSTQDLIGPKGSRLLTRAQLHAYVQHSFDDAGSTNAMLWEEQQWLAMQCMIAAGYLFDPTLVRAPRQTPEADGLSASQQRAWQDTLGGRGSTTPYNWRTDSDWRDAGCIGRAVHDTDPAQQR